MLKLYLFASIFIGLIMILDGYILFKQNGNHKGNKILFITTSIEFIWAIVSLIAIFGISFPEFYLFIPFCYVAYNVTGWIYGAITINKSKKITYETFTIPIWYVKFGLIFGCTFLLLSIISVIKLIT